MLNGTTVTSPGRARCDGDTTTTGRVLTISGKTYRLQGKLLHLSVGASLLAIKSPSMHIHHHRLLHQQVHVTIVVEVEGLVGLAVDLREA